jgi:GT2 family glycosyltransferase
MDSVKISIVIVTFKSDDLIVDCINSIYKYNDLKEEDIEILIVDNSPEKDHSILKKTLTDHELLNIKLFHNPANGGYGQGNNIGIKGSNGRIVCIMNPDVLLVKPIFGRVLLRFLKNEKLAILGGKQLGGRDLSFYIRQEFDLFIITMPLNILLNKLNVFLKKYMFLSGAHMFIDKVKFERIGLYDENIFMYSEESDITRRFLDEKMDVKFDKQICYRHLIDDRVIISDFTFNEIVKSNIYYFKKHNLNFGNYFRQKVVSFRILSFISSLFKQEEKRKLYEKSKANFQNALK